MDGKNVRNLIKTGKSFTPGSTSAAILRDLFTTYLYADPARTFAIDVARGRTRIHTEFDMVPFTELVDRTGKYPRLWYELSPSTIYINGGLIRHEDSLSMIINQMARKEHVLLDMRIYPDFTMIQKLVQSFLPDHTVLGYDLNSILTMPGYFRKIENRFKKEAGSPEFSGKLIVLVDEHTQSLGESIASMLRMRKGTVVVGRQTAGTTGNVVPIYLPGKIKMFYTGVGVVGADNSFRQRKGVKIDQYVPSRAADLKAGRDRILEKAMELAGKNKFRAK